MTGHTIVENQIVEHLKLPAIQVCHGVTLQAININMGTHQGVICIIVIEKWGWPECLNVMARRAVIVVGQGLSLIHI